MSQEFENVNQNDWLDEGLLKLLDRDLSSLTLLSGDTFPQGDFPNGTIFNHVNIKTLFQKEDLGWDYVIKYEDPYYNEVVLNSKFQPKSEELSKYREVSPASPCFFSLNSLIPASNYFLNYSNSNDVLYNSLNLKPLALKNYVTTLEIKEKVISNEKFKNKLEVRKLFKTGDIIKSFRSSSRNGFILLKEDSRVGGSSSSATYKGTQYYDLFELLISTPETRLFDLDGILIENLNRDNPQELFNSGISVSLPLSELRIEPTEGDPDVVTFEVKEASYYKIEAVGGGGGGGGGIMTPIYPVYSSLGPDRTLGSGCGGCSGSSFIGVVRLTPGLYEYRTKIRGGLGGLSSKNEAKYTWKSSFGSYFETTSATSDYGNFYQRWYKGDDNYTTNYRTFLEQMFSQKAYLRKNGVDLLQCMGGFNGDGCNVWTIWYSSPASYIYDVNVFFLKPQNTNNLKYINVSYGGDSDSNGMKIYKNSEFESMIYKTLHEQQGSLPVGYPGPYKRMGIENTTWWGNDNEGSQAGESTYQGYGAGGQPGLNGDNGSDGAPGLMRISYLGQDPENQNGIDLSELSSSVLNYYIKY